MNSIDLPSQQILLPQFEIPRWIKHLKDDSVSRMFRGGMSDGGVFSQVMGGAGFSPTTIATVIAIWKADGVLWQNSTRTTVVTANNDPVGAADDVTSGGFNALQATSGNRPTYKTSVQNGLPGILFNGSSTALRADTLASTFSGADKAITAISAVKFVSVSVLGAIWGLGRSTDADNPLLFGGSNASAQWNVQHRNSGGATFKQLAAGTSNTTTAHVMSTVFDGTNVQIFVDGTQVGATTALNVGTMTVDQFALGCLPRTSNGLFLNGYLFEQHIFTSALATGVRQSDEAYLKAKWATP